MHSFVRISKPDFRSRLLIGFQTEFMHVSSWESKYFGMIFFFFKSNISVYNRIESDVLLVCRWVLLRKEETLKNGCRIVHGCDAGIRFKFESFSIYLEFLLNPYPLLYIWNWTLNHAVRSMLESDLNLSLQYEFEYNMFLNWIRPIYIPLGIWRKSSKLSGEKVSFPSDCYPHGQIFGTKYLLEAKKNPFLFPFKYPALEMFISPWIRYPKSCDQCDSCATWVVMLGLT